MHNYVLSAITGDKFRLNPFQTSDTYSLFQPIHRSRITLWSPREQSQSERSRWLPYSLDYFSLMVLCNLEPMEKNTAGLSLISKHSRINLDRLKLESEQILSFDRTPQHHHHLPVTKVTQGKSWDLKAFLKSWVGVWFITLMKENPGWTFVCEEKFQLSYL